MEALRKLLTALLLIAGSISVDAQEDKVYLFLEEALAMARRVHTSDHPQLALVLGNFGGQLQDMADYEAALPLVLERHAMVRRFYRGDSANVAESLVSLGLLRKDMGDYGAAESLVRQGMEMHLRLTGGHAYG